jgi:hypothetical protein
MLHSIPSYLLLYVTPPVTHLQIVPFSWVCQYEGDGGDCLAQALVISQDTTRHALALLTTAHPGKRQLLVMQHGDVQRTLQ